MPPICSAASFTGATVRTPVGLSGPPGGTSDPMSRMLTDGSTVQVFDQLSTALACLEWMRTRNMWLLQANDDIVVVSVSSTKLLLCEQTLTNQKLLAAYNPVYAGGRTLFANRNLSLMLTLEQALLSVGFAKTSSASYESNIQLTAAPSPHILIVDWYFRASPTALVPGSKLEDVDPLVYDYT
jgi:hypothetical protein